MRFSGRVASSAVGMFALAIAACGYIPASRRVRTFVNDDAPVIVYGASWCPVTSAAMAYLSREHVAYVMRDVDRSVSQRDEMDEKVSRAGLTRTGIPVIDVHGTILIGFDQHQLDHALNAAEPGH